MKLIFPLWFGCGIAVLVALGLLLTRVLRHDDLGVEVARCKTRSVLHLLHSDEELQDVVLRARPNRCEALIAPASMTSVRADRRPPAQEGSEPHLSGLKALR